MASRGACLAGLAIAAAVLAAGCAVVPTSGSVREIGIDQRGTGHGQAYPQLIPLPPGPDWTPQAIVSGFLAASASFASNHKVAREYLTPLAQQSWHPGSAVTLIGAEQLPKFEGSSYLAAGPLVAHVAVTGEQLATLTASGQYLATSGSSKQTFQFSLLKVNNQWRIQGLPSAHRLLLTQDDFQRVYQPRDLYYFDPSGQVLVPDPVFVPQSAATSNLATELVTALLQSPQGWLLYATATTFPIGTKLLGVTINATNATVDLGGNVATADAQQRAEMAAQLVWTLTSAPGATQTAIQSVEIQINGRPLVLQGTAFQLQKMYAGLVPSQASAAGPYFISQDGSVKVLSGTKVLSGAQSTIASPVPGQAGTSAAPALSGIAVAPDGASVAGISANGKVIYTGSLSRGAPMIAKRMPLACTSLSWDRQGDLWVAAGRVVWMLPAGGGAPVPVSLGLPAGDLVTDFRVAPDGVRVAMIVESKTSGTQALLAAITHGAAPSLGQTVTIGAGADPEVLSWYDTDDIIVLIRPSTGPQLKEVPLNGGTPLGIGTEPGTVAIATAGARLAVAAHGLLYVASSPSASWVPAQVGGARAPAFPG